MNKIFFVVSLCVALTLIWSVGVVFLFARMIREVRWIRVLRRDAQPLDDDRYAATLARVKRRLEVSHFGEIGVSQRVSIPLTIGLWRSTVLIPDLLAKYAGSFDIPPTDSTEMMA